jgi:hypothetical protein
MADDLSESQHFRGHRLALAPWFGSAIARHQLTPQATFFSSARIHARITGTLGRISMSQFRPRLRFLLLLTLLIITLACGSSRTLQSVSVMPAVANAQNFPNGQVSFTATGTFSKPPSPRQLTSQDVTWCVGVTPGSCAGNIAVLATVDQNGVASCLASAPNSLPKTWVVMAGKAMPAMMPDEGSQMTVFGSAQLTCP